MKSPAQGLRTLTILLVLSVFLFPIFGCEGKKPARQAMEQEDPHGFPGFLGEAAPGIGDGEDVMATVNGKGITRAELEQATTAIMNRYESQIPPGQREMLRAQIRTQALESLINQQLLLAAADEEGTEPDRKAFDDRYETLKSRFPSPQEFQTMLVSMGMTEQEFRQEVERNLRIEQMIQKRFDNLKKIDDLAVNDFYQGHNEDFQVPERVTASHILISAAEQDTPEERAEKRAQAEELKKQIDGGADFAELAARHSACPSKAKGGNLGPFERGRMVKPFEDAAFSLKKGEVSGVVETPFGYHLIKVTEREQTRVMPLDEVREEVRSYLDRQQREEALNQYLDELRGPAKIEYTGVSAEAVPDPPGP